MRGGTFDSLQRLGVTVLNFIVGVPFWAGVVVGVIVTLLLTAIF